MLKRIKVRGKLLLLLATPLAAVMVFAYSGIVDRMERTEFQEGEARIAELADAGADLSLSIQIERIRVLEIERGLVEGDEIPVAAREQTDEHLTRWIEAIGRARAELTDTELIAELDDLAQRLPATLSPDRGADPVMGTLLAGASRAVDETTIALASEAGDLELFRALSDLNQLIRMQSAYATITSVGSEAISQDQLSAVAVTLISEAERTAENSSLAFSASADSAYLRSLERLKNSGIISDPLAGTDTIADIEGYLGNATEGGVLAWLELGEAQLRGLNDIIGALASDATGKAQEGATIADDEARSFLILAGSVVLLALVMAVVIGRSISRPLIRLTRSAEHLSAEELPALVEAMRSASRADAPVLTPIEAKGRDEVAQLAHAISEIQQVTIDVAEEQTDLLRRGISEIFVNLARRNQSLLDRQIDFIDQLESREENPDQLENLFRLDHLATRMRRNAESLLVLAGAEPTRRRGRPVEIADVLRVAMGEIEDFGRIRLLDVDSSTVAGSVAVDLAHLMSELMENATQFSPPDVHVEVVGYRIADDSYQLTLADRGIGMSADQILTANKTLAEPPLVGLDLSRSLGFTVVSRLAHRLGVTVQLASGQEGGVTAVVTIPAEMVGRGDDNVVAPAEFGVETEPTEAAEPTDDAVEAPAPLATIEAEPKKNPFLDSEPEPAPTVATEVAAEAPEDTTPIEVSGEWPTAPATLSTAPPTALPTRRPKTPPVSDGPVEETPPPPLDSTADGDLFAVFGSPSEVPAPPRDPAADLFAPIDSGADVTDPTPPAPLPSRDPADVGAVPSQVTSAGLIRRTPKQVDVPDESKYAPGGATSTPASSTAPATTRSPEEVRQMLSRYRAGLRKGRVPESGADQSNRRS